MADLRPITSPSLADQVSRLTEEVDHDQACRERAAAERAVHAAAVHAWLSRERAVLAAFVVALPVLAVLLWTNVTGSSLADLLTPDLPPAVGHQRAQETLDSVVRQIGAYRQAYSQLPDSLAEVGVPRGDWHYSKGSTGDYRIRLSMHGQVVTFDSPVIKEPQR